MKKIMLLFLLLIGFTIICIISYLELENRKITFIYEPIFGGVEITYKFTGRSKHFALATGEAYYNDEDIWDKRALLIKNFKLLKEINNLKSYKVIGRFFEVSIFNSGTHYQNEEDIKEFLKNVEIGYGGNRPDPFLQSKEYEFKDNIHIIIEYCLNNDVCYEEELKFTYID